MKKIFDYLRLILFISGMLVGIQLPSFIDQYGKNLEAHLLESSTNLEEFRRDAQEFFDGDLDRLIAHYKNKPDPVIRNGGKNINAIYERNLILETAFADFTKNTYSAYVHVAFRSIFDIKNEVLKNYTYNIVLDRSAIIIGVSSGFLFSVLVEFSLSLLVKLGRLFFSKPNHVKQSPKS